MCIYGECSIRVSVFVYIDATPMEEWNVSDVTRFLNEIKYQQYCNIFEHQVMCTHSHHTHTRVQHCIILNRPNLLGD